jgi:hypothetical protein
MIIIRMSMEIMGENKYQWCIKIIKMLVIWKLTSITVPHMAAH